VESCWHVIVTVGFNNRRMEGQIGVHHSVIDRLM
jgi:hypothetical protein